jgi:hypothetical protein
VAFVVVAVACGIGWTYLLRATGLLAYGPSVPAALPLQQLDGSDAQPLVRLAAAWLPAGAVAGLGLRRAGMALVPGVVVTGALAAPLLMLAGAVADAATVSGSVTSHLTGQLTREGTWAAAGLMAIGAALVLRAGPVGRRAPSAR